MTRGFLKISLGFLLAGALYLPLTLHADNWDPNSLRGPRDYPLRRPLSQLENLADAFQDSSPTVRINVVRDLVLLCQRTPSSCTRAREILSMGLSDSDPALRTFVALNGGQVGLPKQVVRDQILMQLLNDPSPNIRLRALKELTSGPIPESAAPLITKLLGDPIAKIQSLARTSLIQNGHQGLVSAYDEIATNTAQQADLRKEQEQRTAIAAAQAKAQAKAAEQEAIRQRFAEQKRAFVGPSILEAAKETGDSTEALVSAEQLAAEKAERERREISVNAFRLAQQPRFESLMGGTIDDEEIRRYIKEYAEEAEQENFDEAKRRLDLIQQRQAMLELLAE